MPLNACSAVTPSASRAPPECQMPMAGIAWQAVNHLAGLAKLGYDVWQENFA